MQILNSQLNDLDSIFHFYEVATQYMKAKAVVTWPEFDRNMVIEEINNARQWKMVIDNQIACVWAIAFDDPQIWEERNSDPSIYIHRIATNPKFKGRKFVQDIVAWAKHYAIKNGKQFIRLDTVGENMGLINHYKKCGFTFLGLHKLKNTKGLPDHYKDASVSLFEIDLSKSSTNL